MRTFFRSFLAQKNFGFFEIYGLSARKKGLKIEPVRSFFGQLRKGSIFCDFVLMSFMDGPLHK